MYLDINRNVHSYTDIKIGRPGPNAKLSCYKPSQINTATQGTHSKYNTIRNPCCQIMTFRSLSIVLNPRSGDPVLPGHVPPRPTSWSDTYIYAIYTASIVSLTLVVAHTSAITTLGLSETVTYSDLLRVSIFNQRSYLRPIGL